MKRIIDILVACLLIVVLSPVMALTAVVVRCKLGSPVLFRQQRPGRHAVPFTMVKFRTMRSGTGTDEQRLTGVGQKLRSMSLDELPELFNVLRGDMSIVGPRPLLVDYLPLYSGRQLRRHEVRPGLTGLAQASGRNALGWAERLELDVVYVERHTLALDARIIAKTIQLLASRTGISADGEATMSRFEGNEVGRITD